MNKSQEQAVMQLRAKIKIDEALKQHYNSWYGEEVKEVEEQPEEEEDASQSSASPSKATEIYSPV